MGIGIPSSVGTAARWLRAIAIVFVVLVVIGLITWGVYSLWPKPVPVANTSSVMVSPKEGEASVPLVQPPAGAIPLGDNKIVGYTYPLGQKGPWSQSVPEGGFVIVACGNCTVNGKTVSSDGTEGNLFLIVGTKSDGSTPGDLNQTVVIDNYTPGHVQVTFIYAGHEDPLAALAAAVERMKLAPNCGASGCNIIYTHIHFAGEDVWKGETFRK